MDTRKAPAISVFEDLHNNLNTYFTDEYIHRHETEESTAASISNSQERVSKHIGPLEITLQSLAELTSIETSVQLNLSGLTQAQSKKLLEQYFRMSTRRTRDSEKSIVEEILDGNQKAVTLLFSGGLQWQVTLCFVESEGLKCVFSPQSEARTASNYTSKKGAAFLSALFNFVDEEYGAFQSAFSTELQVDQMTSSFNEKLGVEDVGVEISATEEALGVARDSLGGDSVPRSSDSSKALLSIGYEPFYVRTKVNVQTSGIHFSVGSTRPNTFLGRKQGAHITAYIVFVTAVLQAVDEQSIHEIPKLLLAVAKQFVTPDHWKTLDKRVQTMYDSAPRHFVREYRKVLTENLRQQFDEETAQEQKKSMKIHHATLLANLIDDLSNEVLIGINQNETVLYLRPGKTNAADLGREGARIKAAMQNLRAIQAVIQWQNADSEKKPQLLEKFKQSTLRNGLKCFLPGSSQSRLTNNAIDVFFGNFCVDQVEDRVSTTSSSSSRPLRNTSTFFSNSSSIETERISGIACATLQTIGELIFDLFDLDYYDYTVSLVLAALYQEVEEKYNVHEINKLKFNEIKEIITLFETKPSKITLLTLYTVAKLEFPGSAMVEEKPTEITDLAVICAPMLLINFDLTDILKEIERNTADNFERQLKQHFEFIIQLAFPKLGELSQNCQHYVYQDFENKVLNRMHWGCIIKKSAPVLDLKMAAFSTKSSKK